jgi:hypothetical protein
LQILDFQVLLLQVSLLLGNLQEQLLDPAILKLELCLWNGTNLVEDLALSPTSSPCFHLNIL